MCPTICKTVCNSVKTMLLFGNKPVIILRINVDISKPELPEFPPDTKDMDNTISVKTNDNTK